MEEKGWMLFSGSRNASPAMLAYAEKAVKHAAATGWMIVVGDNPQGIDLKVIEVCDQIGAPYIVVSVNGEIRAINKLLGNPSTSQHRFEDYSERDVVMVDLLADEAMFIWDGQSKGTYQAWRYSQLADIKSHMVTFQGGRAKVETFIPPPAKVAVQQKLF